MHPKASQSGLVDWAPVDDAIATVDETSLVEFDENLAHGSTQALIEGETRPSPVARGAELLELAQNHVAVFFAPFPNLFDELFSAQFSIPSASRCFRTTVWVEIPAWSVPGTQSAS